MALLGFIMAFMVMLYISFTWCFCVLYGGLDLTMIKGKQWLVALPALAALVACWYLILTNAPFTLNIN